MSNHQSPIDNASASPWRVSLICLGLIALVIVIYGQTLGFGFVNLDDNLYVTANSHVLGGLSWENLKWVFVAGLWSQTEGTDYWMPLSLLSHMIDVQSFGLWAGGHHLVNGTLFALSVVLLFLILRSMTGALWKSAVIAAIWAAHPLRVESVAWISERKDLLGALFFLLCLVAYLRFVRRPSVPSYLLLVLFFILGLMSKPILVTLPIVLLLLDAWPLGRLCEKGALWPRIWEKAPLFALSLMSCLMTIFTQQQALSSTGQPPLLFKACHVIVSTSTCFTLTFWPVDLAVYYPMNPSGWPATQVVLSLLMLVMLTVLALLLRKDRPYVTVGWFWYLVMLAPVSGIVQAGDQAYADRFTLLPQIGILMALVWFVDEWARRVQWRRIFVGIGAILVIAMLSLGAFQQATYWHDGIDLMLHTLQCTRNNAFAHFSLGEAYLADGRLDEAQVQFQQVLALHPEHADAEYDLGCLLGQKGLLDGAIVHYQRALLINPDMATVHNNLAELLIKMGRFDEALQHVERALAIVPGMPEAESNLLSVLTAQGKVDQAERYFREALKKNTASAGTHGNMARVLMQRGDSRQAIVEFKRAVALQPYNVDYANNLAWTLATLTDPSLRDASRSVELAKRAVELAPENPATFRTLAAAYAASGDFSQAVKTAQGAEHLAVLQGNNPMAEGLRRELALYLAGKAIGEGK